MPSIIIVARKSISPAKFTKAVELACGVDQRRIVVAFAWLMLFRATMMIKGKHDRVMRLGGLSQPNGGSSAVTANLEERSDRCSLVRPLVELLALVIGEEPSHVVARGLGRDLGQGVGHDTLRVIS